MQLSITRDQDKGLLGGVKFELKARVQLTNEEAELVKKYRVDRESLLIKEAKIFGRAFEIKITIGDLTGGQTFKCNDIAEIIETENNVKEACENFKNYIMAMKQFGGEEAIEY